MPLWGTWAPKFLGNGEVTSKSIYERALSARKPGRTGVGRAGVHEEAGAGPSLAEGGRREDRGAGWPGGGPTVVLCPRTPDLACLGLPPAREVGCWSQPHGGGLRDEMRWSM